MSSTAAAGPIQPKLTKASPTSLREAGVTEGWLEETIEKEPTIVGLGNVTVIEHQRPQENAGRLDLLLEDQAGERRFELELMLGRTDASHIIRTIEYWDIERRKWPGYVVLPANLDGQGLVF
jgi:hypothetical protein